LTPLHSSSDRRTTNLSFRSFSGRAFASCACNLIFTGRLLVDGKRNY